MFCKNPGFLKAALAANYGVKNGHIFVPEMRVKWR